MSARASDVPPAADLSSPSRTSPGPLVRNLVKLVSLTVIGALLFVFHGLSFHLTPWSQAIISGIVKRASDARDPSPPVAPTILE